MVRLRIAWNGGGVTAHLSDTPTARQLMAILPCRAVAQTWGEEIYFQLPLNAALETNARQVVEPGTVCFWVEGSSLALPFGPTPASHGQECRLVTRCNVLGHLEDDPRRLKAVKSGHSIRVELLSDEV